MATAEMTSLAARDCPTWRDLPREQTHPDPHVVPVPVDVPALEALLRRAGDGPHELLAMATADIVRRLGDRGFCLLVGDVARVVLSTEFTDTGSHLLDLARYPEIVAALASQDVVAIEDVHGADLLKPVCDLLPSNLGAVAAVPLIAGDRVIGVIVAQSTSARRMDACDIASARLEGRLAATLLDCQFGQNLAAKLTMKGPAPVPNPKMARSGPMSVEPPVAEERRTSRSTPREILIADCDTSDVLLLTQILAAEGFGVRVAKDAESTIVHAKENHPDLILIDNCAPGIDGLAVARELARDEGTCFIPILLLCRTDDLCLQVRGAGLDSVDFLRKPCSPVEMRARIERSLSQADTAGRLRVIASIDELTGLGNLRCLRERLGSEKSRLERYGTPMAMMMIDVDKLKDINDQCGHSVGSEVLKAVATTLRSEIRDTDTAVRYGGDEFVVLLPHTLLAAGGLFARRVLGHSREIRPQGVSVSLSIGVAGWETEPFGNCSVDELLAQADAAAYRAKRSGGNQICLYDRAKDVTVRTFGGGVQNLGH